MHDAIGDQLGVQAEVVVIVQQPQDRVRNRADSGLTSGSVGDALGDEGGDLQIALGHRRRRRLDERIVGLGPTDHLAEVQRVLSKGARHVRIDFDEERHPADEPRGVVGIRAQRYIAVPVRR